MRALSVVVLLGILLAAPAVAQWQRVPLPPQIVSPSQVATFGFAEGFGGSLFVSTGFPIPQSANPALYEHVFVTHDGGATWAAVPEFTLNAYNRTLRLGRPAVAGGALYLPRFIHDNNPTPAALSSTVLKTTDGTTWTTPAAAGLDPLDGVLLNVARQGGVLYGHSERAGPTSEWGYVYRSADEGATWARIGAARSPGFLYNAGGRLLLGFGRQSNTPGERSADGGATWTPHGSQIFAAGRNAAGTVLTGALSSLQRSTDGGMTFAAVPSALFGFGGTMALVACDAAFVAVALQGGVKRSDDGGTTWTLWGEGLPEAGANVRQMSCSAGGPGGGPVYVYAAVSGSSADAGVYRRDLAQTATVAASAPGSESLALAVAPNPTRGTARLAATLRQPGPARLTVSDALGREVAVVVDAELPAGTHDLPLDTSRLAPGVYVVRLATSAGTACRALTVLR